MNSSTSETSGSDRVTTSGNCARPTVAPATHGDHAPAESTDISKRKPWTLLPSRLNAGTRRWAGSRGRHSGNLTTRSSPSRSGGGAASIPRAHDGGTARARESDDHAEAAAMNRSVAKQAQSLETPGDSRQLSGAWAKCLAHGIPCLSLRRLSCASRLAPGGSCYRSWAPLGAASRLRGARLSSPVAFSPTSTSLGWSGPTTVREPVASP